MTLLSALTTIHNDSMGLIINEDGIERVSTTVSKLTFEEVKEYLNNEVESIQFDSTCDTIIINLYGEY